MPIAHQLDMFDCQTGDTGVWIDIIFVMLNFVHQGHDYGYEVEIIKIAWSLYLSFCFGQIGNPVCSLLSCVTDFKVQQVEIIFR